MSNGQIKIKKALIKAQTLILLLAAENVVKQFDLRILCLTDGEVCDTI